MKYFSTRGGQQELSFEETVLTGLAADGGLFIPTSIPTLPENWESEWKSYTFQQLSFAILSLYIPATEIPPNDLRSIIDNSYTTFRHQEITPLHKLNDDLLILELFHGPTYAFKDVALQFLGNLFEYILKRKNASIGATESREKLTILGATSGDTGSAAIYGLRGKSDISIYILHPKGRISPIQEAQMTTVTDPNVHNVAVVGTFDDCQSIVKDLFGDEQFNKKHSLGAVNSINWARILAQMVYFFKAYFEAKADPVYADRTIQFVVPTGNFGDILAGYYCRRMGLPTAKLAIATNANDILARFWKEGKYEKGGDGVVETCSPAMDIVVSSNFERLLWYLAFESVEGSDRQVACQQVKEWMAKMKSDGKVPIPVAVIEQARADFVAERVSNEETLDTIKSYYASPTSSYIADPHTAVGLKAAEVFKVQNPSSVLQIVLSTAHPAKFSEAVTQALDGTPAFSFERDVLPEEFKDLLSLPRRVIDVPEVSNDLVKKIIDDIEASS